MRQGIDIKEETNKYINFGFSKSDIIESMSFYIYLSVIDHIDHIDNEGISRDVLNNIIDSLVYRDLYSNDEVLINMNNIMDMIKNSYPNLFSEGNRNQHKDKIHEVITSIKGISDILSDNEDHRCSFISKKISEYIDSENGIGVLIKNNMGRFWYSFSGIVDNDTRSKMKLYLN